MTTHTLKSFAVTIALVLAGAACGWGLSMLRPLLLPQLVESGDFSRIIEHAHHPAVLFATSTCPHCRKAREFLNAARADYLVYEIDTSTDAEKLYQTLGLREVPVLVTQYSRIVGFDEHLYRQSTSQMLAHSSTPEPADGLHPERTAD